MKPDVKAITKAEAYLTDTKSTEEKSLSTMTRQKLSVICMTNMQKAHLSKIYEIKEEVAQDYTLYEKIVSSLNLTENMRIALECRQNGLSYPEIGRVLSRAQATVYEYFIKMRQRYMAIYG